MKRNVKKLLIASLVIFLLGAVICSVALIYAGAKNVELFDNNGNSLANSYEISLLDIEKVGMLAFSSLKINAEKSDVRIVPTEDETYIRFENPDSKKTVCIIENGVLKIDDSVPFYVMGLSFQNGKVGFEGFRNVFTNGPYSHTDKSITVYLSENDKLNSLEISLSVGDVFLEGGEYENVNINTSVGNAALEDVDISATAVISLKMGDISVKDSDYVFLDASCGVGDADIDINGRKTNCETALGSIKVQSEKPLENYNTRASVSQGKILINGKNIDDKKYVTTVNDDAESIWFKTSVGDISLYNSVTSG